MFTLAGLKSKACVALGDLVYKAVVFFVKDVSENGREERILWVGKEDKFKLLKPVTKIHGEHNILHIIFQNNSYSANYNLPLHPARNFLGNAGHVFASENSFLTLEIVVFKNIP